MLLRVRAHEPSISIVHLPELLGSNVGKVRQTDGGNWTGHPIVPHYRKFDEKPLVGLEKPQNGWKNETVSLIERGVPSIMDSSAGNML